MENEEPAEKKKQTFCSKWCKCLNIRLMRTRGRNNDPKNKGVNKS